MASRSGQSNRRTPSSNARRSPVFSFSTMSPRPSSFNRCSINSPSAYRRKLRDLLDAHDLQAEGERARAVEFRDKHALSLTEHELAGADLQRQAMAEQHRPQVCVRVQPIAV